MLLFVVLPQNPVKGDLCAEDGEEKGEEAVAEVVAPGGVDDEGAGDGEGGDYEEEGDPEHHRTEGPSDDPVLAASALRQAGVTRHVFSPFSLRWSTSRPASLCSSCLPSLTSCPRWCPSVRPLSGPAYCS